MYIRMCHYKHEDLTEKLANMEIRLLKLSSWPRVT